MSLQRRMEWLKVVLVSMRYVSCILPHSFLSTLFGICFASFVHDGLVQAKLPPICAGGKNPYRKLYEYALALFPNKDGIIRLRALSYLPATFLFPLPSRISKKYPCCPINVGVFTLFAGSCFAFLLWRRNYEAHHLLIVLV